MLKKKKIGFIIKKIKFSFFLYKEIFFSRYSIIKNIFLGGSLIKHGGQNPLEAVRYNCNIIHGPSVENFNEIFQFLKKRKISYKIDTKFKMIKTSVLPMMLLKALQEANTKITALEARITALESK